MLGGGGAGKRDAKEACGLPCYLKEGEAQTKEKKFHDAALLWAAGLVAGILTPSRFFQGRNPRRLSIPPYDRKGGSATGFGY
jgi:hypothetical protein